MAPLWDYGCHIQYRRPELSTCHTLILVYPWYLRAHSWVMDPLGAVSRDGYWPSLSGAQPTALHNSALLEHCCLALIAFCMVGLRHKMEVNTQMYLKRRTRTTYTMADEKVY